ncbi:hypothetical protein A2963_00735, partial [Candidatus Roizmanbacteria bacterium RIFCSPLOWO2_01_FULL_40_13]
MKFYKVSWEELVNDCLELNKKIRHDKFDRILCVSRGGLIWARMLSDLLGLPVSHLTVSSYQDLKKQKEIKITETPSGLQNQYFLIVDEIVDTGGTLKVVTDYLKSQKIKKFKSLAPIVRTFSNPLPDYHLKTINDWVIFPYELKETYEAFVKIYKSNEKA